MFTKLTTLQPDNAVAFQMLGTAYHAAGQFDQAVVAYERSNALAPKATAYTNIGILHHARGDYAGAIVAYRQSLRLQPKEASTHRNMGDTLWMTGDRAGARAEYQKAIDLANEALTVNAKDGRTHSLIAFCEAKLGRTAAAQRSIAEAARLAPNDGDVVYDRAVIATLLRQYRHRPRRPAAGIAAGLQRADARRRPRPRSAQEAGRFPGWRLTAVSFVRWLGDA